MQHRGAPSKRKTRLPPVPTWTCPHCDHVHTPATLMRLDNEHLQCAACGKTFKAAADPPHQ
jgi:transcription elongation factor Elf1